MRKIFLSFSSPPTSSHSFIPHLTPFPSLNLFLPLSHFNSNTNEQIRSLSLCSLSFTSSFHSHHSFHSYILLSLSLSSITVNGMEGTMKEREVFLYNKCWPHIIFPSDFQCQLLSSFSSFIPFDSIDGRKISTVTWSIWDTFKEKKGRKST